MIDSEQLDKLYEHAESVAVHTIEAGDPLAACIGVWKDGEPYAYLFPGEPNPKLGDQHGRDPLLRIGTTAIKALTPDAITIVMDSYAATSETKTNGEPWGAGEMQYAVENNTEDAHLVGDQLCVWALDFTGSAAGVTRSYTVETSSFGARTLVWGKKTRIIEGENPGDQLGGYVFDVLREAYQKQSLVQLINSMKPDDLQRLHDAPVIAEEWARITKGTSLEGCPPPPIDAVGTIQWAREHPVEAYAHQVCAAIKALFAPMDCAVLLATQDPLVAEIYSRSLTNEPGIDAETWTEGEDR